MKKLMYFAAALLVLVGCNKKDNALNNAPEGTPFEKGQQVTLTVGTGAQQGPNKVAGVDNTAENRIDFTWEEGDKILVKVGDKTAEFTLTTGAGSNSGVFAGEMPAAGSTFDIQYPIEEPALSAQEYTTDKTIPADKMLFMATNCTLLSNEISLTAQYAMVQLNLYGTDITIGQIVLTNTTAEPAESYTLTCTDGVTIGATSTTATPFYIIVPAGAYKFEVEVYDNATTPAMICSFATSAAQTFTAGKCLNMPAKEVLSTTEWTTKKLDLGQSQATSIVIETGVDVSSYTEDDTHQLLNNDNTLWAYLDGDNKLHIQTKAKQITAMRSDLFFGYNLVESISGLQHIYTTSTKQMFYNCINLINIDFSGFNTTNVTDMSMMFMYCNSLTNIDLSGFNTANVTDMSRMFQSCLKLSGIDLSGFNTAKVTNMSGMFASCIILTDVDISGFNTANVTNMSRMFGTCKGLKSLNLSSFNTANVTDMSCMFEDCNSLESLTLSDNFKVANNRENMFSNCGATSGCTIYGVTDNGIKNALMDEEKTNWGEYMHFDK